MSRIDRRDFMKLAGLGGVMFASGLGFNAVAGDNALSSPLGTTSAREDCFLVKPPDTHWGVEGPNVNPDAQGTLKKAVAAVNSLNEQPDFVVFTGDLTQTTGDPKERRDRTAGFQEVVSRLKAKPVRFIAGEHDASLDRREAYQQFFGELHYAFDHKGMHFIVLDSVSDPEATIGEAQLGWLQSGLNQHRPDDPIVVLTHRRFSVSIRNGIGRPATLAGHPPQ